MVGQKKKVNNHTEENVINVLKKADVIILSFQEIRKWESSRHLVELTFVKDPHFTNKESTCLYALGIATTHYKYVIDLMQRYKDNPQILTNGIYDRRKALDLCNKEFHHLAKISLDCGLYDFTINELTNGQHEFIYNSRGNPFYIYHYVDSVPDRDIAKRNCSQLISDLVRKGVYSLHIG